MFFELFCEFCEFDDFCWVYECEIFWIEVDDFLFVWE